jgi:hypothetical protein
MNSMIAKETAQAPETASDEQPKTTKKAARARRRAPVATAKGKAGKKASSAKKTSKGAKQPARAAGQTWSRDGSKTAVISELLKRPEGATAEELMKATGWQPHSVRGFLSGTLRKKMGLEVISTKGRDGERTYSVKG